MSRRKGGLYVWRVNKPHALLGWPIIGRHFGYAGMTNSFYHREKQHLEGSMTYGKVSARWSDLRPKVYRIPLPNFILHGRYRRKVTFALETLMIAVLCPVYNVKQQPPWNFRKIPPARAYAMRAARDSYGRGWKIICSIMRWTVNAVVISVLFGSWWLTR